METSPAPEALSERFRDAICWQVYPLGFCGAPLHREDLTAETYGDSRDGHVVHRLDRVQGWLDHLLSLGGDTLILNPIFDSVSHGYDTIDHLRIDPRLGDAADFESLLTACHERGIRLVLDGVFNHVSHRHPLVRRALAEGPDSEAGALIRWSGTHPYGFEGNDDLVELDLANPRVQERIAQIMTLWLDRRIDGWRLDAMYAAGAEAWRPILDLVRAEHPDAWILGELIHGDQRAFARASGASSITQYELWKAIWSSIHDRNLFELAHALGRHEEFVHGDTNGTEDGAGGPNGPGGVAGETVHVDQAADHAAEATTHADEATAHADGATVHVDAPFLPLTFLDNHDTTRITSQLPDGRDLAVTIALLALLPGIPCLYAGDELGAVGIKEDRAGGDDAVRPLFPASPTALREGVGPDGTWHGHAPEAASPPLELISRAAAPRILEVHQRLLGLRRRHRGLAVGHVRVDEDSLTATSARIVLDEGLVLVINISDEPLPAAGEVLEQVSGADMIDGVGPAAPGSVPAHGAAILRAGSGA